MTSILGISAFYHDAAAALVVDGRVVGAAQQERFSRIKHDPAFPADAAGACLAEAGLDAADLDYVAFYDKPMLKFERLLETYLAFAPLGFRSFLRAMPQWLHRKLHVPREIARGLGGRFRRRVAFVEHHLSHAAAAFYPSPFEEAAILTVDGVGEWATASYGSGRGRGIELTGELRFPHSLGLLYSAFTAFCGFRVNSGEYKLMGLAPYGEPAYADLILGELVDLKPDGSLRLNLRYFSYCHGLAMTNRRFARLFGGPPRRPDSPVTRREMDLAASIQRVTEEAMLRMARHVHAQTNLPNLCLGGGVALNCVANARLLREGPFERVWIQPAAGDAGGAVGAALLLWHEMLESPRTPASPDGQAGSLLGPAFGDDDARGVLDAAGAVYETCADDSELCRRTADLLADGKIVGWVQGRMEFGPRALGARSILADPRRPEVRDLLNRRIKFRESFRPFAPAVTAERAGELFDMPRGADSPYMLLIAPVRGAGLADSDARKGEGPAKLDAVRSPIPAVTHVDGTARVQTVTGPGRFAGLLRAFEAATGCPALVNTSFNVRGEPIVCTPADALACFRATDMDALVIGRCVLLKADQPPETLNRPGEHLARFDPD